MNSRISKVVLVVVLAATSAAAQSANESSSRDEERSQRRVTLRVTNYGRQPLVRMFFKRFETEWEALSIPSVKLRSGTYQDYNPLKGWMSVCVQRKDGLSVHFYYVKVRDFHEFVIDDSLPWYPQACVERAPE